MIPAGEVGAVAQAYVLFNVAIALGYLFVPVLVLPYLRLRRRTVLFGAVFFIGCTGSHVDMVFDVIAGDHAHPQVGVFAAVWHGLQALGTWGFILCFRWELRAAGAAVDAAEDAAREFESEFAPEFEGGFKFEPDFEPAAKRRDNSEDLSLTIAALRAANSHPTPTATDAADTAMEAAVKKFPGQGEWIKAAPAVFMVCGTIIMVAVVSVFTVLAVTGTPTDAFFRLINLFFNALGAVGTLSLMMVALVHARRTLENRRIAIDGQHEAHRAAVAATSAARAMDGELDRRVEQAVEQALRDLGQERGTPPDSGEPAS